MHSPNHSLNESAHNRADGSDENSACGQIAPLTLRLADEAATLALASTLAPLLTPGMVVWLDGDLGSGKTTLVRALLRARGHRGAVKSPTYALVEVYVISSLYWYHFDFYRFSEPEEFDDAGLNEYFRSDSVCLVEWPEKAVGHVPLPDLTLALRFSADSACGRVIELGAGSEVGRQCLSKLHRRWSGDGNS